MASTPFPSWHVPFPHRREQPGDHLTSSVAFCSLFGLSQGLGEKFSLLRGFQLLSESLVVSDLTCLFPTNFEISFLYFIFLNFPGHCELNKNVVTLSHMSGRLLLDGHSSVQWRCSLSWSPAS